MNKEQKILEILLGAILVVLLVLMVFLFTSSDSLTTASNQQRSPAIITNSFNTNYYNIAPSQAKYYKKIYENEYLDYSQTSYKKTKKGFLGNDVDEYIVSVKNQDYKGGYFQVKFYFTDYYGNTDTETMTYYLAPKQSKKFIYKDIYSDGYKFYDWDYEILSKTKVYKRYY